MPARASPRHVRGLTILGQLLSLFATASLVWSLSIRPRLHYESLAPVFRDALQYTLLAWCVSLAIMLSVYLVIRPAQRFDAFRRALRMSRTAVWFAPAVILLSGFSPAAIGAALVLVFSATRLLYSEWLPLKTNREPAPPPEGLRLVFLPERHLIRDLAPASTVSFGLQATVVAMLFEYRLLAAAFLCLSVAVLSALSLRAGLYQPREPAKLPQTILGILLTVILAAGLTVGGLAPDRFSYWSEEWGIAPPQRPGATHSRNPSFRSVARQGRLGQPSRAIPLYVPERRAIDITDKSFPGVILWPEEKTADVVLTPPSLSWARNAPAAPPQSPAILPFSGQYWMYKFPNSHPPEGSYFRKSSPLALSFVTTDNQQMSMEANQLLQHRLDLQCCREIEVVVSNADRYPGTIGLELILIDSEAQDRGVLSLGTRPVTSRPAESRWHEAVVAVGEILKFSVPAAPSIRAFDQIRVVFHRDVMRADRSARISIDRFRLVP